MRITGGMLKGRRLKPISWSGTRCSTDMVRQALFNILGPEFNYSNVLVLDCFAGSGAVSLEFISRGVKEVVSIDSNRKCFSYMKDTKSSFAIDNWQIKLGKVNKIIKDSSLVFDLVFADPPYADTIIDNLVDTMLNKPVLKKSGIFVLEHSSRIQFDRPELFKSKIYGESCLSFYKKEI